MDKGPQTTRTGHRMTEWTRVHGRQGQDDRMVYRRHGQDDRMDRGPWMTEMGAEMDDDGRQGEMTDRQTTYMGRNEKQGYC